MAGTNRKCGNDRGNGSFGSAQSLLFYPNKSRGIKTNGSNVAMEAVIELEMSRVTEFSMCVFKMRRTDLLKSRADLLVAEGAEG